MSSDAFSCSNFQDDVFVENSGNFIDIFENTNSIRFMHEGPPRFGHGKDMTVLINGTKEEQEDYIRGLVATSAAIFTLFFFWLLLLIIFKALGPYSVGFLSGRRVPLPPKPSDENGDLLETWEEKYRKMVRNNNIYKGLIVFAGLSIITCSILLTINGFKGLIDSVETGLGTIDIVKGLLAGGIDLIDRIVEDLTQGQANVDQILSDMNTICPAVRETLCTDLDDIPGSCNFDGVFDGDVLKETMTFMANLRIDITSELLDVRDDLVSQVAAAEELQNSGGNFDWALYCAIGFSLALAVLVLCLMLGACFKLSRVVRCFQNCILVPLFVVLVTLSWAFSMAFVLGSMSLADFCVDSPDDKLLTILEKVQDEFSPFMYAVIVYYISGCPLSETPNRISEQIAFMGESVSSVESLFVLDNGFQEVLCDSQGIAASVAILARALSNSFCGVAKLLSDTRDFLRCENWFPLYENTVYDAMCIKGTDGFAWVTITQFIIVIMAVIILTFRIAFFEIEILSEEDVAAVDNGGGKMAPVVANANKGNDNSAQSGDNDSSNSSMSSDKRREQPQPSNQQKNDNSATSSPSPGRSRNDPASNHPRNTPPPRRGQNDQVRGRDPIADKMERMGNFDS